MRHPCPIPAAVLPPDALDFAALLAREGDPRASELAVQGVARLVWAIVQSGLQTKPELDREAIFADALYALITNTIPRYNGLWRFSTCAGRCAKWVVLQARRTKPGRSIPDEYEGEVRENHDAAIDAGVLAKQMRDQVDTVLSGLEPREQEVLRRRYLRVPAQTLDEIAEELGLCGKQRAHQIEVAAMRRITE